MEPIKPGTRCECRLDENGCGHKSYTHTKQGCRADAVRMVIVENDNIGDDWIEHGLTGIPMCAACAEFHEKGAN